MSVSLNMYKYLRNVPFDEEIKAMLHTSYLLTIYARETYDPIIEIDTSFMRLKIINEIQHKILSHLTNIIQKGSKIQLDETFYEMLEKMASEGGVSLDDVWQDTVKYLK